MTIDEMDKEYFNADSAVPSFDIRGSLLPGIGGVTFLPVRTSAGRNSKCEIVVPVPLFSYVFALSRMDGR